MSFFKDLKEDIVQSVNELSETIEDTLMESNPEDIEPAVSMDLTKANLPTETEVDVTNEVDFEQEDIQNEVQKEIESFLEDDQLLNDMTVGDLIEKTNEIETEYADSIEDEPIEEEGLVAELLKESLEEATVPPVPLPEESFTDEEEVISDEEEIIEAFEETVEDEEEMPDFEANESETELEETVEELVEEEAESALEEDEQSIDMMEEKQVSEVETVQELDYESAVLSDETTVITKGTTINGGIKSDTSLEVKGVIEGDVECLGKLSIMGKVAGNSTASEIYVNTPRLEGNLESRGNVKIDVGTVVIGSISSASVEVSGAVKGDIEVNGPVVIDSTAVVRGNIIGKSIQINSGAVIDGFCSLKYADVDLDTFFE